MKFNLIVYSHVTGKSSDGFFNPLNNIINPINNIINMVAKTKDESTEEPVVTQEELKELHQVRV